MPKINRETLRRTLDELATATHTYCAELARSERELDAPDAEKLAHAELVSAYQEAKVVLAHVDTEDKAELAHQLNPALGYDAAFGGKAGR